MLCICASGSQAALGTACHLQPVHPVPRCGGWYKIQDTGAYCALYIVLAAVLGCTRPCAMLSTAPYVVEQSADPTSRPLALSTILPARRGGKGVRGGQRRHGRATHSRLLL